MCQLVCYGAEASLGTPYSTPSDLWALGVLVYELLHLRRPFEGVNVQAFFQVRMLGLACALVSHILLQGCVASDLPGGKHEICCAVY